MFDYVIASLSPEVATEICDLILTTPEDHQYDALKAQLIQRTAISEQQQLLGSKELGDCKLSVVCKRHTLDQWCFHLPTLNFHMVLASTSMTIPLSDITDRIMEVAISNILTTPTPNLATVSSSPQAFNMRSLHAEITQLKVTSTFFP